MFTRLLVGLDGSPGAEAALAAAIDLGRRFRSTILLAAISDVRALDDPLLKDERATRLLTAAAARVRGAELGCEEFRASGLVDQELIVLSDKAEAIVVGRRGEMHAEPGTIGAVTARIVRKSPRPVVVAGERPSAFMKPVVAYDGGVTSSSALTLAARYADAIRVPLDVVTVSDRNDEAEELLARAGAFLSGEHVDYVTHRLTGDVTKAIATHVEQTGADLLVAGAHGGRRKRISWSLGSHAEELIRATQVPVIINR